MHTVIGTTAKVSDMSQFEQLLHGDEEPVSADRGAGTCASKRNIDERLCGSQKRVWAESKCMDEKI